MSRINHRRPFQRQSSLQTPPSTRTTPNPQLARTTLNKPPLIGILRNKQRSEELQDHHYHQPRCQQRPSQGGGGQNRAKSALDQLSSNHRKLRLGNNPMVKVAWGDSNNEVSGGDLEPSLMTREVVLSKGTVWGGSGRSGDLGRCATSERERGLVLCSREQLAHRLRIAWQERDTSKKNVNIILTPQITTDDLSEDNLIVAPLLTKREDAECHTILASPNEKTDTSRIVDVTNIFRRTIPRRTLAYEQNNYEPSRSEGDSRRSSAILIVPIVENNPTTDDSAIKPSNDQIDNTSDDKQSDNLPQHKRDLFQKRSNAAFNTTVDNPSNANTTKWIRASSVPAKTPTNVKLDKPSKNTNTIPKRRRIKSTTNAALMRRNSKYGTQTVKSFATPAAAIDRADSVVGTAVGNQHNNHAADMHRHSRDIVTMVSLLSPNLTDNDDDDDDDGTEEDCDDGKVALISADGNGKEKKVAVAKGQQHQFSSLRKTVKSVSFQQSSIHSVRSFCASFPGRRGSVGTSGNVYSVAAHQPKKPTNIINITPNLSGNKLQEKRGSFSEGNEDGAKPKRRLVRTVSDTNDPTDMTASPSNETAANQGQTLAASNVSLAPPTDSGHVTASEEAMVSDKEAYCVNTHRKLTDSGINISLETILRGMLTPTEYRLRCKRVGRQDGDGEKYGAG